MLSVEGFTRPDVSLMLWMAPLKSLPISPQYVLKGIFLWVIVGLVMD